jgi:hypothetical protein
MLSLQGSKISKSPDFAVGSDSSKNATCKIGFCISQEIAKIITCVFLPNPAKVSRNIRPRFPTTSGQGLLQHSAKVSCDIRPIIA